MWPFFTVLTSLLGIFLWAFGGSGPELIKFINRKRMEKSKSTNSTVAPSNPQNTLLCEIESDIKKINNSISTDMMDKQSQTFLRYYEKYKNQLQDAETVYKTFEGITNSQDPIKKYEIPLSSLLGQLERIKVQYLTKN